MLRGTIGSGRAPATMPAERLVGRGFPMMRLLSFVSA